MAVRRSIHAKISLSESVEAMSEWAQLLWDRIFVHADDFGRLEASPVKVKGKCKPLSSRPTEDFAMAIAEMATAGMVDLYEFENRVFLKVITFDRHQTVPKRTESKFPQSGRQVSPDEYLRKFHEVQGNNLLARAGGIEKEIEREKEKEKKPLSDSPKSDAIPDLDEMSASAMGEYNSVAAKWDKPKITAKRVKRIARRIHECDAAMNAATNGQFSFALLLGRVERQAEFFRDKWQAWDLEWFVATKRGEFVNAMRAWTGAYRQLSAGRSPPSPQRKAAPLQTE